MSRDAWSRIDALNERLALAITRIAGSMGMAYFLVFFYIGWIAVQVKLGASAFDPYPFVFLLFISNALQLWWLPVLSVGQNVLAREDEKQQNRMEVLLRNQADTMSALRVVLDQMNVSVGDMANEMDALTREFGKGGGRDA